MLEKHDRTWRYISQGAAHQTLMIELTGPRGFSHLQWN